MGGCPKQFGDSADGTRREAAASESARYLDEAVAVSRQALRVATELNLAQQIGMSQDNLGNALREKGWRCARDAAVLH